MREKKLATQFESEEAKEQWSEEIMVKNGKEEGRATQKKKKEKKQEKARIASI